MRVAKYTDTEGFDYLVAVANNSEDLATGAVICPLLEIDELPIKQDELRKVHNLLVSLDIQTPKDFGKHSNAIFLGLRGMRLQHLFRDIKSVYQREY